MHSLNILIMQQSLLTASNYLHATQTPISNQGSQFSRRDRKQYQTAFCPLRCVAGAEKLLCCICYSGRYIKQLGVLLLVSRKDFSVLMRAALRQKT